MASLSIVRRPGGHADSESNLDDCPAVTEETAIRAALDQAAACSMLGAMLQGRLGSCNEAALANRLQSDWRREFGGDMSQLEFGPNAKT
jgi:6-phosphogluconate dehydrogenase (decarboxylating)